MALLIIALVIAAAALVVGSRQTKVPPPFGLARNGADHLRRDGDIYTVDPVDGHDGRDRRRARRWTPNPVFSHDGTRIAFRRGSMISGSPADDIVVVKADGSQSRSSSRPARSPADPGGFEWAPDSRSLLVGRGAHGNRTLRRCGLRPTQAIWLFDATAATPRGLATDAFVLHSARSGRPMARPSSSTVRRTPGSSCSCSISHTGHETLLADGGPDNDLGAARWSPDGTQVVYNRLRRRMPRVAAAVHRQRRRHGHGARSRRARASASTSTPPGRRTGSRIAFSRYEHVGHGLAHSADRDLHARRRRASAASDRCPARFARRRPNRSRPFRHGRRRAVPRVVAGRQSLIAFPSEATGHPVADQSGRRHLAHRSGS